MKGNGFFAMLARMKHISRWGLMRNTMRESLSEHSFDTAVTAHALAVIANTVFGKGVDEGKVAAVALFHDASEILTGDMPTPVKYNNPEIKTAYKSVEQTAKKSLLSMLPGVMAPKYEVLFAFEHDSPELYAFVKAADKISAYIKCAEELKSGNLEFKQAAEQLKALISGLGMPEADYYMQNFAPSFDCTLDELQEV